MVLIKVNPNHKYRYIYIYIYIYRYRYRYIYKRQIDIIKNQKSKEKLEEKAPKRYQNLSEEQEKKK